MKHTKTRKPQNLKETMYNALLSHFKAEREKALATLSIYFESPVGVGEHPQVIEEMIKLTKEAEEAEGCIDTLKSEFGDTSEEPWEMLSEQHGKGDIRG